MKEEVWSKEEQVAVDALAAVIIGKERTGIGGEIRRLLRAAHTAEQEKVWKAAVARRKNFDLAILADIIDKIAEDEKR